MFGRRQPRDLINIWPQQGPEANGRRMLPPPKRGWEWSGLRAETTPSLIPPDRLGTYTVVISEDGTFRVTRDPS